MPEYLWIQTFTAADDRQAARLGAAWGGTCAAEYDTRNQVVVPVEGELRDRMVEALRAHHIDLAQVDRAQEADRCVCGDLVDDWDAHWVDTALAVVAPEVERLRERWESAQRHAGELIDRAERAEAEAERLRAELATERASGVEYQRQIGYLAEDVRRAEAERDAAHAAIRQAREELRKLHVFGAVRRGEIEHTDTVIGEVLTTLDAALDAPSAPESTDHANSHGEYVDGHGRTWDPHPFVQSRAVDNVRVCVCGQPPSHHAHAAPETRMRPVSVESPGNDGFRYEPASAPESPSRHRPIIDPGEPDEGPYCDADGEHWPCEYASAPESPQEDA